jgi:TolB-like protein/Flp pilus assembly protein TadD
MSESTKAVFLSYASQDAEAAKRICDALRAAGVEVWFDADGGLEHGDEWDAKIRKQVKECVLFIAVISANTQAREEGYFRLEWDMAAERARSIASGVAFIFPVLIDGTKEAEALVPDRFRTVQWAKLPGGAVPPDVLQRLLKLWSHRTGLLKQQPETAGRDPSILPRPEPAPTISKPGAMTYVLIAVAIAGLVAGAGWWFLRAPAGKPSPVAATSPAAAPVAPLSEARKLAQRAQALIESLDGTRDDYKLAEELIAQAKAKDPTDAEVWASEAHIHESFFQRGWDTSDARRESARVAVQRAMRLDSSSFEARFAQARLLGLTGREGEDKERQLRDLRRERPADQRILRAFATVVDRLGHLDESAAIARESDALAGGDPLALYSLSQAYWFAGRAAAAEATLEAAIAEKPFASALLMNVWYKTTLRGDITSARQLIERLDPALLLEDRAAFFAYVTEFTGRNPDKAIAWLQAVPRDWLNDSWYRGPKGLLVGNAHQLAGRTEAARVEWQSALKLVEQRLVDQPKDRILLSIRVELLARLGQPEEAARQLVVLLQIVRVDPEHATIVPPDITEDFILLGRKTEALRQIASFIRNSPHWSVAYPSARLRLDPAYDPLRGEPEFAAIIADAQARERALTRPTGANAKADSTPTARAQVDDKSVAVLAFANLSDDKANEYFSDGISEELLNVLAKVPGLKVTARTSSFYFKGKEVPVPEIAQQLGVAYVIEGSVRKAGNQVRITAQLIKAADGFRVWSDTFTRDLKDVFAVQDEIAGLVARNLSLTMGLAGTGPRRAVNPAAHQLVLEGRYFWNLRTTEGFDRAEAAFTKAIALDPEFAQAYAGLADVRLTRSVFEIYAGANTRPTAGAREATERALTLDPMLAEAYPAAGAVLHWTGRLGEAEQQFKKAIALNPNYALAHHWYSLLLEAQGRLDAALAEIEQAIQLDPLSMPAVSTRHRFLLMAGRISEALVADEKSQALRPGFFFDASLRAQVLLAAGRRDEALAAARSVVAHQGLDLRWISDASAVYVLRALGREAEAVAHVEKLLPRLPADSYLRGLALAALDRWDEAMPYLERTPPGLYSIYFWNPLWDRWREDPRFGQLLVKLNCVEEYKVARATLKRMQQETVAK